MRVSTQRGVSGTTSRVLDDHGGGLLANHNCWRVSTGIQCSRHDRGVGDAQPLHPNNAQPRIDYSGRIVAHPACTTRMEVSRRAGANVFLDHGLIVSNWTRRQLRFNKSANWWLAHHVAHAAHRTRERSQVFRRGKVFRKDPRMSRRICRAQQDPAAAVGTARADHNCKAMTLREQIAEAKSYPAAGNQRRHHDDDRVRDRERWVAAHIAAGRNIAFGERAATRYRIPQSDPERRPRVEVFIGGYWLRACKAQRIRGVVLQIATDLRRIDYNWNPQAGEMAGGPDTRQHQELG